MRRVQAFVAMPFNPVFHPVWRAIKKACEQTDIVPIRVDQLPLIEDIHKTIFSEIEHSDIVIIDFSGDKLLSVPNPNVVTEATHAKVLRKPIVILTQSTDALPFDWRTHRAVVYENNKAGLEYLAEVLEENLAGIKSRLSGEVKKENLSRGQSSLFGEVKKNDKQSTTSKDGRYSVLPSGIIQDTKTNLEWLVGPDKDTSWDEAKAWVANISVSQYGTGWRMPTRQELPTIYEKGKGYCNIDPVFVSPREYLYVWSGELKDDSSSAWYLFFHYGNELWHVRSNRSDGRVFSVRFEK